MYPITSLFFLEILFSGYSREEEREPCEQTPTSIPPSTNGAFLPRPQGLLLDDFKKTDSPARSCPPFRSGKTYSFRRYGREVVEALCFVLFHITF